VPGVVGVASVVIEVPIALERGGHRFDFVVHEILACSVAHRERLPTIPDSFPFTLEFPIQRGGANA
jgi:hypothetical protein